MVADVFQVLAEPRRRDVLALLADRERTAGDIAARFDVTRQAISQHLRILLQAGLIEERREGTRRWYRARPEGLAEVPRVRRGDVARRAGGAQARRPSASTHPSP